MRETLSSCVAQCVDFTSVERGAAVPYLSVVKSSGVSVLSSCCLLLVLQLSNPAVSSFSCPLVTSRCLRACEPNVPFLSCWCPLAVLRHVGKPCAPLVPVAVYVVLALVQSRLCPFCWVRRLVRVCVSCLAEPALLPPPCLGLVLCFGHAVFSFATALSTYAFMWL